MNSEKYTFDNFIVSEQNELPYFVTKAIGQGSTSYNPICIYGKWRSGKTHLLYAIRNALQEKGVKVLYVTGEQFYSDLLDALAAERHPDFLWRYQSHDVIIIDNIEECTSRVKARTQETYVQVIDSLLASNKQIVITSELDFANNLPVLYHYLTFRCGKGMIIKIAVPTFQ